MKLGILKRKSQVVCLHCRKKRQRTAEVWVTAGEIDAAMELLDKKIRQPYTCKKCRDKEAEGETTHAIKWI
jgi:predicted nucleic-acid-binding Zn-ribbon protein